ncbi:rubrerythrin [candidate division WOR-3 bacterium]|uniref:Rubrerythrin n=1 Tax=candidate division WOR-3 bacterium TaxID=2052148 RepID=A0A9D5K995_UNCW3|nr:rubrerythrin [candidate division WOR-3 bacterium]MBD3364479.1 rubrerythrin [candidate division WOR-3 bacterium]
MDTFGSVNELLDFAIGKELEANQFYVNLSNRADRQSMKEMFDSFAAEELKHKEKLEGIKQGKKLVSAESKVTDLKIADYTTDVNLNANDEFDFQKALLVAMQREKASYKLYSNLAEITEDEGLKEVLLGLANEEAKHKLYFETQYDEYILSEN